MCYCNCKYERPDGECKVQPSLNGYMNYPPDADCMDHTTKVISEESMKEIMRKMNLIKEGTE